MRIRNAECIVLAALALSAAGCPSMTAHQGTEPVAPGAYQLAVGAGASYFVDVPQGSHTPAPSFEVSLRRGLVRNVDLQVKLYTLGLDLGVKYRFLEGPWSIAMLPALGASRLAESALTSNALYIWGHLALILGRRINEGASFNLGPRMMYGYYFPSGGGAAHGLSVGGFVNLELRLTKRIRCVPEVALLGSLGGDVPVRGWSGYAGPGFLFDL